MRTSEAAKGRTSPLDVIPPASNSSIRDLLDRLLTHVLVGADERPAAIVGAWSIAWMSAAMLTILLLRPIWDCDIFWQLKLGEMIMAHGGPIGREPFAITHLGEPLPAVAWLGQVVMAETRLLAGWTGLRVLDAICWLGGFLVVAATCRRHGYSAIGIILALGVAFYIAYPTASIRPQTFAVLGFGVLMALLRLDLKPGRLTLIAAPVLLLWQNLHPSVSVAVILFGTYAAVDWARWLRHREPQPWELSALTVLAGAAMFATPDGWSILRITAENASASTTMGVSEWFPLWQLSHGAVNGFVVAAAVLAGLVALHPRRVDPREMALAMMFLALTVFANRFIVFWALSLVPAIARSLTRSGSSPGRLGLQTPLLLAATAATTPLQYPTEFAPGLALNALHRLQAENVSGVIFAHASWGGPAIDLGYPRWRVAYDGRLYRYSPDEWQFYAGMSHNDAPLAAIERRYRPAAFVLDRSWSAPLISEIRASSEWKQIWSDDTAVAFTRQSATSTLAPLRSAGVEVRRLVGDPAEKSRDAGMPAQRLGAAAPAR